MSIPIIIYSIIENSINCFKYLLINGEDPRKRMKEENPDAEDEEWESSNMYEWECKKRRQKYSIQKHLRKLNLLN